MPVTAPIIADYVHPPIPTRQHDWCAVREDYDPESNQPRGWGATKEAAIADLLQQEEDNMADEHAAPEWPEDVVDAVRIELEGMHGKPRGVSHRDYRTSALNILAAIAPHVTAREQAAWIAGRDAAVALLTYDRVFRAIGDAARFEGGRTMSISVSKFVAAFDFAALTPPTTSALDALVAARVAEALTPRWVWPEQGCGSLMLGRIELAQVSKGTNDWYWFLRYTAKGEPFSGSDPDKGATMQIAEEHAKKITRPLHKGIPA